MPKIIFILFIIFWNFPIQIYSISGTEEELFKIESEDNNNIDPENVCPCDLTKEVCDQCCYCDKDCSTQILHYKYVDVCGEGDSSSYVRQNIDENLEYCNDFKKTLDELYNPLVLGFQILKRGLCLYKNKNSNNNESKNNDNNSEEGTKQTDNSVDFTSFLPENSENKEITTCEDFQRMNISATMALPSGFCLFGAYPIKCLINYEVTCTYPESKLDKVKDYISEILNVNPRIYLITNNYYYDENVESGNIPDNTYPKKIEIIFYVNKSDSSSNTNDIKKIEYNIYYNYKNNDRNNDKKYLDFTQTVTFLHNKESDYLRSGSPGYIKGKPILIGREGTTTNGEEYRQKLKQNLVIPLLDGENKCPVDRKDNSNYYYDNYLDNMLTFEDTIIFSCKNPSNDNTPHTLSLNLNAKRNFGKYGDAYMENIKSWGSLNNITTDYYKYTVLYVDYIYQGAVNSTQLFINQMSYTYQASDDDDKNDDNYTYFIVKSLTPYERKTRKFTAKPPGILKLPRNIMYPFRTETTTYKTKS